MVVADIAVATQNRFQNRLAVHRQFQRQAHIDIVEGRHVGAHRHGVMGVPGGRLDFDVAIALEQVDGLQVDPVHHIHLAGGQRVGARRDIGDGDHFEAVKMTNAAVVIVGVTRKSGAHARLEAFQHVRAGTGGADRVDLAILRRFDGDVIVAGDEGEVGVAALQLENHRVFAVGLQRDDLVQ